MCQHKDDCAIVYFDRVCQTRIIRGSLSLLVLYFAKYGTTIRTRILLVVQSGLSSDLPKFLFQVLELLKGIHHEVYGILGFITSCRSLKSSWGLSASSVCHVMNTGGPF